MIASSGILFKGAVQTNNQPVFMTTRYESAQLSLRFGVYFFVMFLNLESTEQEENLLSRASSPNFWLLPSMKLAKRRNGSNQLRANVSSYMFHASKYHIFSLTQTES
jgi:hypothetical protein